MTTFTEGLKVACPLCNSPPGRGCVRVGPFLKGRPCSTLHNERLRMVPVVTEAEIDAALEASDWPVVMLSDFTRAKMREFAYALLKRK
jgi:hypothetical protein